MRLKIVRIGNSRGVRLPAAVLQQAGLEDEADLQVVDGAVVLRRPRRAREGWDAAFAAYVAEGAEEDLLGPASSTPEWDAEEWTWR